MYIDAWEVAKGAAEEAAREAAAKANAA